MEWHRYCDKQPEDDSIIIQLDKPVEGYYKGDFTSNYDMRMRKYNSYGLTYADYAKSIEEQGGKPWSFWWCYAKDFPFPDKNESK